MVIDFNFQKEEKAELPIKITFVGIVINSRLGLCENVENFCDISCHGVVWTKIKKKDLEILCKKDISL